MTPKSAGLFVTFEGPEGSGKSLQARLLAERLERSGYPVLLTREPGGTPLGDRLRELLLLGHDLHTDARAEALMMCAARAQLVEQVILPALREGRIVVCDRFGDSTLAYQGVGRGLDLAELRAVLSFATQGLIPDLTVLLDIPVAEGLARKEAQGKASGEAWNRFEAETLAFHERVREGYRALRAEGGGRWHVFDARQPPEILAEAIWRLVEQRVNA